MLSPSENKHCAKAVFCQFLPGEIGLRTLFPLTEFKNAPNPKFVQNLSQRLFLGVPVRGTGSCQKKWSNLSDKFLTNSNPPDWNPQKQSLGQILDKFGVRGFLNAVRGKRVRTKRHKIWHPNFTTFFTASKGICHLHFPALHCRL